MQTVGQLVLGHVSEYPIKPIQHYMMSHFNGKARVGLLLLSLCLGFTACEKKEVVQPGQETEKPGKEAPIVGEPTEVGTPTGDKISQSIGPAGGVIRTADGNVSLTIPAGALSQPTTISLQPIENKALLGIGSAYEFSPDGLKFAKPAQLVVKYEAGSLDGTSPEAIGIAFQDEKRVWQGKMAKVNTTEGTFTASVPHFSSWAFFKYYSLIPESVVLAPTQTQKLEVLYVKGSELDPDWEPLPRDVEDNDLIAPLVLPKLLKASQVKNWLVSGENLNGRFDEKLGMLTVLEEGAAAEYKAPSKVPPTSHNPIAVSVELKLRKGQLILISNLTIAAANEMIISGKRFENPITEAEIAPGFFMLMMTERRVDAGPQAFLGATVGKNFKGVGTYAINEDIIISAQSKDVNYDGSWLDPAEDYKAKYGPGSITITKFDGAGKPVAGTVTATLHYQSPDYKEHKTITVTAKFKTATQED
jgi:hypothetical protein